MLTIIVATDADNGIGIQNALPWHLPEDLAHFKRTTSGHPIIMGRKTFESIGRPLPKRRNIVITRDLTWHHDGVETVHSIEAAIALVNTASPAESPTEAFIIGGAEIYAATLPLCTRLLVTEIEKRFDCDAFFPARNSQQWQEVARTSHHSEAQDFDYAFVAYQRA
ncbi:dihydrofolate reductase [Glaciimonas immobilis]|uniref:Dihydrofolate reductase n=2 Tax=Glaciimonas immobilis TaxID=728004 RepID=A0A840RSJ7_9BURK|nr:dihydrofolate reductase [Glaciimonas immobilis]